MKPGDVIVAQATPAGASALAVIRLSGQGCSSLAETALALAPGRLAGMRRAVGSILGSSDPAASCVAFSWPEGRSFTGEEMVDLMCFGASSSVEALLSALLGSGARPARPGEFSRRALENGRLSPLEVLALASAWGRAADGGSGIAAKAGELLEELETLGEDLEGSIEFSESAGGGISAERALATLADAAAAAAAMAAASSAAEGVPRIFLMGPVNAGKSSLFNALAGRRRAVVSPEPGTTRDGAAMTVSIGGMPWELRDSPGTAEPGGPDSEALEIALAELTPGDRVLWLSRGGAEPPAVELDGRMVEILEISSCCDLIRGPGLNVSSVTGEGLDGLKAWISSQMPLSGVSAMAGRLERLLRDSGSFMTAGEEGLAAASLEEALDLLRWFLDRGGRAGAILDRALSRMCVGK